MKANRDFVAIMAFVIINGIFLPNELYLTNIDEFSGGYKEFLLIMFIGSMTVILGMLLLELLVLPEFVCRFCNLVIAGLTILEYIQYIFLNGKLESITGDLQNWKAGVVVFNGLFWTLIIAIIVFMGCHRKNVIRYFDAARIYIVLIQLISNVYLTMTTDISSERMKTVLTTEGSLELADDRNVIIFVLDRFDSQWMQELFDNDSEFFAPLSDFTFYNNATSNFTCTYASVPYLLNGIEWSDDYKCGNDYLDALDVRDNFLMSIKNIGFNLGVYTDAIYIGNNWDDYISNYDDAFEIRYKPITTYNTMWKTSLYKVMPFAIKNWFAYNSDDINGIIDNNEVWNTENDYPFYENLINTGLSISSEYDKAFRFYHMHGAHAPYILSSDMKYVKNGDGVSRDDQIRGCLEIVYEYLSQLKELELYDNATIIITADHGMGNENTDTEINNTSSPIIAVKNINSNGNVMSINSAPVTQREMISTIAWEAGLDISTYGKTLEQTTMQDNPERYYIETYADQFSEVTKYVIRGNVHDINSRSIAK